MRTLVFSVVIFVVFFGHDCTVETQMDESLDELLRPERSAENSGSDEFPQNSTIEPRSTSSDLPSSWLQSTTHEIDSVLNQTERPKVSIESNSSLYRLTTTLMPDLNHTEAVESSAQTDANQTETSEAPIEPRIEDLTTIYGIVSILSVLFMVASIGGAAAACLGNKKNPAERPPLPSFPEVVVTNVD